MSTTAIPAAGASTALAGKYLTVLLADESYGIAVRKVREIIRLQKVTPVPQLPDFVKGVINLRGRVIPVVDLRTKFGLPATASERTCIIVVQVNLQSGAPVAIGLVVDSVDEVLNLTAAQIEPTPEFGVRIDETCLIGMAKVNGAVKILLDVERVVTAEVLVQAASRDS